MYIVPILLQSAAASDGTWPFIMLGVITLAALVALGLKFFTNMFEVISAPGASLGHLGRSDNFFFGLTLVILAGLIGSLILLVNQPQMVSGFHEYSADLSKTAAQANSNENYREIAAKWGTDTLDGVFTSYFSGNLVFYPIVVLLVWLVLGFVLFGIVRMVGGQIGAGAFLTMMAYPYFFGIIGFACLLAGLLPDMKGLAGGAPAMGIWTIIGGLLFLYSLILTMIGVNQGAECGTTRMLISVIILLILLGGGSWAGMNYGAKPRMDKFQSDIKGLDPSKENYKLPSGI
jgi:hypothetical protein